MPFITIEYTHNLTENNAVEPSTLVQEVNNTLMASGQFGDDDIKTVASAYDVYARGTQPQNRAFLCVNINILSGRTPEIKQQINNAVMKTLQAHIKSVAGLSTQISVNLRDMDRGTFVKTTI